MRVELSARYVRLATDSPTGAACKLTGGFRCPLHDRRDVVERDCRIDREGRTQSVRPAKRIEDDQQREADSVAIIASCSGSIVGATGPESASGSASAGSSRRPFRAAACRDTRAK